MGTELLCQACRDPAGSRGVALVWYAWKAESPGSSAGPGRCQDAASEGQLWFWEGPRDPSWDLQHSRGITCVASGKSGTPLGCSSLERTLETGGSYIWGNRPREGRGLAEATGGSAGS